MQTRTRLRAPKVCLKRSEWVAKSRSRMKRNDLDYIEFALLIPTIDYIVVNYLTLLWRECACLKLEN
jgi:hypothetical protein